MLKLKDRNNCKYLPTNSKKKNQIKNLTHFLKFSMDERCSSVRFICDALLIGKNSFISSTWSKTSCELLFLSHSLWISPWTVTSRVTILLSMMVIFCCRLVFCCIMLVCCSSICCWLKKSISNWSHNPNEEKGTCCGLPELVSNIITPILDGFDDDGDGDGGGSIVWGNNIDWSSLNDKDFFAFLPVQY